VSDNTELHAKIMAFLSGEFARKEGRQCVEIDLIYAPGNGYKDEEIRKWSRVDQPELFDVPNNFANLEGLVTQIIEIAEGETNAKSPGRHRYMVRTHQHLGGRAFQSFALAPQYTGGGDDVALMTATGGKGDQSIIANHASQLMRINAQMYEGTIRVLGSQNADMRQENAELRAENINLRREVDEARSNKLDREFQIAMAAEKNARTNEGFQKLLQLGSVVAAKIGGGAEGGGGGNAALMLLVDLAKSLRPDQVNAIMSLLDMPQKIMFMELLNMLFPPEKQTAPAGSGGSAPSSPQGLPSSGG